MEEWKNIVGYCENKIKSAYEFIWEYGTRDTEVIFM